MRTVRLVWGVLKTLLEYGVEPKVLTSCAVTKTDDRLDLPVPPWNRYVLESASDDSSYSISISSASNYAWDLVSPSSIDINDREDYVFPPRPQSGGYYPAIRALPLGFVLSAELDASDDDDSRHSDGSDDDDDSDSDRSSSCNQEYEPDDSYYQDIRERAGTPRDSWF